MKKIVTDVIPSLDQETVNKMTKSQTVKYTRLGEILFMLQILKKLLSPEMVDKVENIDGQIEHNIDSKRTYIFTIRESFNNFIYTYSNCVYNLLRVFLPAKQVAEKETDKIFDIPELKKIIDREQGIRHVDVHQVPENRYDTLAYLGTWLGLTEQDKVDYLKATENECIKEIAIAYDKVIGFSEAILLKIDSQLHKKVEGQ